MHPAPEYIFKFRQMLQNVMDMTGMYIYLCKNIDRFSLGQKCRRNYFGQDYPEHTLHVPLRMGRCLITSRSQLVRDDADHNIQTDNRASKHIGQKLTPAVEWCTAINIIIIGD